MDITKIIERALTALERIATALEKTAASGVVVNPPVVNEPEPVKEPAKKRAPRQKKKEVDPEPAEEKPEPTEPDPEPSGEEITFEDIRLMATHCVQNVTDGKSYLAEALKGAKVKKISELTEEQYPDFMHFLSQQSGTTLADLK